jgi:hypothetical protein
MKDFAIAFALIVVYVGIGIIIARYMGGDRSKLSPDVTYLDWLGFIMIVLFWPFLPLLAFIAFLNWIAGGGV